MGCFFMSLSYELKCVSILITMAVMNNPKIIIVGADFKWEEEKLLSNYSPTEFLLLNELEIPLIELSLRATRGNQIKAAELLGLNRNTLRKKIKELEIQKSDYVSVVASHIQFE